MKPVRANRARMRGVAEETFGYDRLRPGQPQAIEAVTSGHDTLAVMPTGSGKSAIYQIAALMLEGPTVVVSPLIALQHDQVAGLAGDETGGAAVLNSTQSEAHRDAALEDLAGDEVEFLFLAPEQFNNQEILDALAAAKPSLFVVDEAHCVSEWGHDFRPEYLRLGGVIEALGHPTVLALTATAAPPVRDEIIERLGMRDERVIVRGFDRPNIWLGVEIFADDVAKERALVERVVAAEKPGIVYVATRKHAEDLAGLLSAAGVPALAYHAGLPARERQRVQQAFMDDSVGVIVATVAFGMGVDKPNVRFVFHYDMPESLDAYYQEVGRGGRDDQPARAILFYCPCNVGLQRFLASSGRLDADQVQQVARIVHEQDGPVAPADVQDQTDLSQAKVANALQHLEAAGVVESLPTGEVVAGDGQADLAQVAQDAVIAQERRRQYERTRVDMMRGYAETPDCRRRYLLNYFGEEAPGPCGYCDNCDAGRSTEDQGDLPFALNSEVRHRAWGTGRVIRYENGTVVVLFEDAGYKTLALDVVLADGLLTAA